MQNSEPTTNKTPRDKASAEYVLVDKNAMQAQYQMDTKLFGAAGVGVGFGVVLGITVIGGFLYYQGVIKIANLKE